jgi:hypothetical protein
MNKTLTVLYLLLLDDEVSDSMKDEIYNLMETIANK